MKTKKVIGLTVPVKIYGKNKELVVKAKVDTGASTSSIDESILRELGYTKIIGSKIVRNAHGASVRLLTVLDIEVAGKRIHARFNIFDRQSLRYKVLLGVNVLKRLDCLIDPSLKTTP